MRRQVFIVWFVIFLLWAFYRASFVFSEATDELFVKPLIFVLPVLYIVLVREKKPISDLGLYFKLRDFLLDLNIGVLLGVAFTLEALMIHYAKYQKFLFSSLPAITLSGGLLPFMIINFATSCWEEILGRGYLFNRLNQDSKNTFWAATLSSFLFLFLHIPMMFTRLHLMGISILIYPVTIFLLSMTNCYIFSVRKNLTLPILVHFFWNMTMSFYL